MAELLQTDVPSARSLAELVYEGPRDVFGLQDLALLRSAKAMADRNVAKGRIVQALEKLKEHGPNGESLQNEFDFARGPTGTGWMMPARSVEAEGLFVLGLQTEESNPTEAADCYTEALAANPHHADAHVNLGRLLHTRGKLREAEAHYVAALIGRPKDAIATFNLAVVLDDQGRIDEAIRHYTEAIELDPKNGDAYLNLARLYERKGEKLAAIRHLKDARKLMT
ncbi:MAG: tetratricopeptide repeat protein [Myxococcaceae bacterium]